MDRSRAIGDSVSVMEEMQAGQGPELAQPSARPRWIRLFASLSPAVLFVALLSVAVFRSDVKAISGNEAPSFELELLGGGGTLTDEDLRGKPVVVNFWASWCIPCREEAPMLERVWKEYRDDGVVFLGVNIKDAESDALEFVRTFGITYPNVRDLDQRLTRGFGIKGLPETFFIDHRWTFLGAISGNPTGDQQGTVVVLGAISEDELVSNIEVLVRRASSTTQEK